MAGSHAELTSLLRGEVDDAFEILSDIAAFTSINGIGSESTDLVIRALEKISRTGPEGEILRSLAMLHGLYPYAVQGADHYSLPSRANLVCWPFGAGAGAGGGEDLAGGAGQRVGGDVGVTGDDDGDLLQRA